jgi:hypothetical protein
VAEREKGEEKGVRPWGCHVVRGRSWGLAPTGGRRPDRVPAGRDPDAARAGDATLFGPRRAGADGRAPAAVRAGRERRGARRSRVCVGRPEKKTGWPSLDEQYSFGFI